jgi:hypothetical protein
MCTAPIIPGSLTPHINSFILHFKHLGRLNPEGFRDMRPIILKYGVLLVF